MTSVLIVEDQRMPRENMEHLVEDSGRYRRVASLSTAEMALAQCARHTVDLVLMDVCTKGSRDGIDVAAEIKARYPETKVIIITSMVEESYLKRAKAAGAESFWYKDVSPESLLEVMDRTMAGESLYPDRTPETRLGQVSSTQLTPREIEVLRLVCEGLEYEEIAAEPQDNKQSEKAQETLKDAEVKYNKDNPTTNPDGSQKLDGVIVTNPEGSGETDPDPNPNPGSGETNPNPNPNPDSGKTDPNPNPDSGETGSGETGGTTDPEQKKPEEVVIGTAEKTEKSETNVETKPNPGAEPIVDTTTPPTVEKKPDGSTAITQPTVTPGKETTTTTGSGTATGNLNEKEEEVKEIDLDKELGENPDISWDIKQGDKAVEGKDYTVQEVKNDGNKQTLVLRKEDTKTAEMTAEDIAKLVDAEKPTVNPDGTYTLTRTETILDAEGNPQTRTTYITIQDNKVTTKTTTELTITREKIEHNEEASIPTDVVLPDVKLNNNETLSHTKLDEMLKEKGGKDANGVKDGEYTYKETAEDGTVREYTIKIDTTSTDQLTNKEIVDKLNDKLNSDRYSAEGEDIYYRADNGERVKLDVKQKAALRRNLSIDVSVTETKKDTKTEAPDKETAENEVKDKALREALYKAAGGMTTDEATLAELKKAIDAGTFNRDEGGVFTATVGGKTYSFEYYGAKVETTVTDEIGRAHV